MAHGAGLGAWSGHVPCRHGGAGPVGGVMAPGTVAGYFLRVAARQVAVGPTLQIQGGARIESKVGLVAGSANRRYEGVLGRAHGRGTEAAGHVVLRMTGAAVAARRIRNVRGRQYAVL